MKLVTGVMAGVLLLAGSAVTAGEIDLLTDKLAEKGIITYGEAQTIMTQTKENTRKELAKGEFAAVPLWAQNLSLKGDLRLRYQTDWAQGVPDRNRARLRLRIGAKTRIVENMKAGFGLATGGLKISGTNAVDTDPRSTNFTFGDTFSKGTLFVDYAYLEYSPFDWVSIVGGKMKNPLWQSTDIVMDTDLNPDGIALPFKYPLSSQIDLFATVAGFIIDEAGNDPDDPAVYVLQPGALVSLNDRVTLKVAAACYSFNVQNKAIDNSAGTNTTNAGKNASRYAPLVPSLDCTVSEFAGQYSVGLFADYVVNTATSSKNTGYGMGVRLGDAKVNGRGTWQIRYIARALEKDAFPDAFPDSDSYGGQTNVKGNELIVEMGLTKSASLSLDYYAMDRIDNATAATPRSLLQMDIIMKF